MILTIKKSYKVKLIIRVQVSLIKRKVTTQTITETKISNKVESGNGSNEDGFNTVVKSKETKSDSVIENRPKTVLEEMEENNKVLQDIINTPSVQTPYMSDTFSSHKQSTQSSLPVQSPRDSEKSISDSAYSETSFSQDPVLQDVKKSIQIPQTDNTLLHSAQNINEAILPIIATSKLTGQALSEKLEEQGILLEETEQAEVRQEALYKRICEFVESLNFSKRALKYGLYMTVAFTVYHILRYRQIPLGGFIKGMMGFNNTISPTMPNVNPITNINISMPSFDKINELKQTASPVVSTIGTAIGTFIDNHPVIATAVIPTIIFMLKKIK